MLRFTKPFFVILFSLYTIFMLFAVVGICLFNKLIGENPDKITRDCIDNLFYLMNFNDFGSAYVTLFHILMVNNWFVTCDMFVEAIGHDWPRVYFAVFWLCSVCFIVNILLSFLLEIYSSVSDDIKKEYERRGYVKKMAETFCEGDFSRQ